MVTIRAVCYRWIAFAFLSLIALAGGVAAEPKSLLQRDVTTLQAEAVPPRISDMPGPNWGAFFNADGTLRDELDRYGAQRPNGIPDAIDLGGLGAAFLSDRRHFGNAYAFLKRNGEGQLIVYLGLERLAATPYSTYEFELNQNPFRLQDGGPDAQARSSGGRSLDDLMVRVHYGENGALESVEVLKWAVDSISSRAGGRFQWAAATELAGEGCNDQGVLCAVGNSTYLRGESWKSYSAAGMAVSELAPNTFTVLGINAGRLVGHDTGFLGIQVSTAGSLALSDILGNMSFSSISAAEAAQAMTLNLRTQQSLAATNTAVVAAPSGVSFAFHGCRNDGSITLPNGGGQFICPDGAYTGGSLGKGWNELDLVPYRLTAEAGNSAPTSQTYTIAILVDSSDSARPGFDALSVPVLNAALSSSSCSSPTVGDATILSPGLGGVEQSLYRLVTVTQTKNTNCVYDYFARLALGSHLWPGASLHANLASESLSPGGVGSKEVSIPVREVAPQGIDKDMTASQWTSHVWELTRNLTPNRLDLSCDLQPVPIQVTVQWTKRPAGPKGEITVITHVYATNPASRSITVSITDVIRSGAAALDTAASGAKEVPGNARLLVLTHQTTLPAGTANLNDIATATYTDSATGIPVAGQATATATAIVQLAGPVDTTAEIRDSSSITGAGLSYSVDNFIPPASGGFDGGYVAGARTDKPVSWKSVAQSDSGSVTFYERVYVDCGAVTNGRLSNLAVLTGSSGFTASSSADVPVSADATLPLTIEIRLPAPATPGTTFTFNVSGAGSIQQTTISVPKEATGTSGIVYLANHGIYTVTMAETGASRVVDLTESCSGSVLFTMANGRLEVVKTVNWNGVTPDSNARFEICITGPSYAVPNCKTTTGGDLSWNNLIPGAYTIIENAGAVWEAVISGSPANVTAGGAVATAVTNTYKRNSLTVTKVVNWNGTTPSPNARFEICITGPSYAAPNCKTTAGGDLTWNNLIPGSYVVVETAGAPWEAVISGSPANVTAGGAATASITNTYRRSSLTVRKTVDWNGVAPDASARFEICITGPSSPTPNCKTTAGGDLTWSNLIPGTYTVTENPGTSWNAEIAGSPAAIPGGGAASVAVKNTYKRTDKEEPTGVPAHSIGFWKNWASCAKSNGSQGPILDQTLAKAEPGGITIGILTLHGDRNNANLAPGCSQAVRLLNKSNAETAKKMASDPAFNLAAQFLAAMLNKWAGAWWCENVKDYAARAQALLAAIRFDGNTHLNMSAAQAAEANYLAQMLDNYNNNLGICPATPVP